MELTDDHNPKQEKQMNTKETSVVIRGENPTTVQLLEMLFQQLAAAQCESNPFADSAFRLEVNITHVEEGSAFLRYLLLSLAGRPKVGVHVRVSDAAQVVWEGDLSSSVFFEDRIDQTFRGGAFGGANLSFVKANCRRLCEGVVRQVSERLALPAKTVKTLRKATRSFAFPKA
jgi:hypothetical protein